MAGKDLNKELKELIQSCKNEGILCGYIDNVIKKEDENDPNIASNFIKRYIDDSDDHIAKITPELSRPDSELNYGRVRYLADAVNTHNWRYFDNKGVHNASNELAAAAYEMNKAECFETSEVLISKYLILKGKLTQIAELKKKIEDAVSEKNSKNDEKVDQKSVDGDAL